METWIINPKLSWKQGSFSRIHLDIIIQNLNWYFDDTNFLIRDHEEWSAVRADYENGWVVFKSFHELEEFLEERLIIEKGIDKNIVKPELNILLFSLTSKLIKNSNVNTDSILYHQKRELICNKYQEEVFAIFKKEREKFLSESDLEKYTQEEIEQIEWFFSRYPKYLPKADLYNLIRAYEWKINLEKLWQQQPLAIQTFIKETWYKKTLEALHKWSISLRTMIEDWDNWKNVKVSPTELASYIR